jgi:hypothetical protein
MRRGSASSEADDATVGAASAISTSGAAAEASRGIVYGFVDVGDLVFAGRPTSR